MTDYLSAIKRPLLVCLAFLGLAMFVSPLFYLGVIILLLDIVARYRDFLSLKGRKYNPITVHRMKGSWCSRGVAETVWPQSKEVYYTLGYRSYHILPDGFPGVFANPRFWRSVVGWKTTSM